MIRVLHIGSELTWRGGESQVAYLLDGLRAQGDHGALAYPAGSAALARLAASGPTLALRSRHGWDPRVVAQVAVYCREQSIAILDAHSSRAHALGLGVKRRCPELKLVVHRHIDNALSDSFLTRRKYLGAGVDRFVAISSAIARILTEYGIAPERITVVKSATDAARFTDAERPARRAALLQRLGLPDTTVLIGNASALTEQKGYPTLIDALHQLVARGVPVHGVFAGEGELRSDLEAQVARLDLGRRLTFLGFEADVAGLLQGLDILAVPSNHEGLGTVIQEGILAGCAVAATAVGGIPEIVIPGETGLLSPVGDAAALARNLEQLVLQPELRAVLVARAQAKVREEFSVARMVEGNRRVYQELLAHP